MAGTDRYITGRGPHFRPPRRHSNFYRVMFLLSLILAGVWLLMSYERGQVKPLFLATPTPTRAPVSYLMEAQAYFDAGIIDKPNQNPEQINDAIEAYRAALAMQPDNVAAWTELARIEAYSSGMLRNDKERQVRLEDALEAANQAVSLAPDDSQAQAVRAFVLDWYAYNALVPEEQRADMLFEAEQAASRAFQLDPNNALALAYYAEILADQMKWTQAEKYARQALELGPEWMDTHRVYAYVQEAIGNYNAAIEQYQRAAEIAPNMTFLYIRIGQNFREGIKNPDRALEYFDRAARINEALGVENPIPYIEIAKTYTQQGQFFAASVNAEKALSLDKENAHTYGQLGIIFIRARNYEGAMPLLRCAVRGCTAEENEMGGVAVEGLDLTSLSIAYYYVEYGTVQAFLSRERENYCYPPLGDAMQVLQEVRERYSHDPILTAIVEDSEGICRRLGGPGGSSAEGTSTPSPSATPEMPAADSN